MCTTSSTCLKCILNKLKSARKFIAIKNVVTPVINRKKLTKKHLHTYNYK